MQAYAACDDPEIGDGRPRTGYGDLVELRRAGLRRRRPGVSAFFATGMLLNVLASMQVLDDRGAVGGAPARGLPQDGR